MIDFEDVKAKNNIVDAIGSVVQLKKTGKNHTGLCPFHDEKTPSFTVEENKQFFHCFGCGASGDVVDFVKQYHGVEAVDAAKMLGGTIEKSDFVPRKRRVSYRVPPDSSECPEKIAGLINKCRKSTSGPAEKYIFSGGFFYPIVNYENKIINARVFRDGQPSYFAAHGPSYNGFTPLIVSPEKEWVSCVSFHDGLIISNELNVNVAVCWSSGPHRWLTKYNFSDKKITPALREDDDDYLKGHFNYIDIAADGTLTNKEIED